MKTAKVCALLASAALSALLLSCGSPKNTVALAPEENIDYSKLITKGPKKRIAIGEFENKSAYSQGRIGNEASDKLAMHLTKSNGFIMIERSKLDKVLGEQSLAQTGAVKGETAAKAGELLGVQAIILGAITEFGQNTEGQDGGLYKSKKQVARAVVTIRAVDTTTGQIIFAEEGLGTAETETKEVLGFGNKAGYDETLGGRALNSAIVKLVSNLIKNLEKMEWNGKVVDAEGGSIIVNAGKATGLQVGDTLVVSELGQMLTDPDTGLAIGRKPGAKKGKIKIVSFMNEDASVCEMVDGTGFTRGDQVKLGD